MRRRPSVAQTHADRQPIVYEGKVGRTPISAKLSPHGPVFGVQSPAHRSDSGTFSTADVFILALMGRTPWSAADAHVGLFRGLAEPDQGVRRGRGRPPHSLSASEPLSNFRSVAVSFFPQRDIAQQHVSSYRDHHQ